MNYSDIPTSTKKYFESLSHEGQQEFIGCLVANRKPMLFTLKVKAEVEAVSRVLAYLKKHSIDYKELKKVGSKVHFIFDKHEVRNEVLVGMNTL